MSETDANDRATWLKGPPAECSIPPGTPKRVWRIALLGAPGVGKGTQAAMLAARLEACHLSTGDVFRAAKSARPGDAPPSPAMCGALEYMKRGDLVPDSTVLDIIRERSACLRCRAGFLLDGFPRTVTQAQSLALMLESENVELDAVVDYQLDLDQIIARLSGRRTCEGCKAVYHVQSHRPRITNVCDHCGGMLVQREDDRPESIRVRLDVYHRMTAPLTTYYARRGLLRAVRADGTPQQIFERTLAALGVEG